MFRNINMKRVSGTKNSRTHQEPGDVFEYCFLPDDGKKKIKHSGDVFRKYRSGQGECARKYKPRRHSSVHKQVSKPIIKIGGTCRNIQGPGCVVFGEFFLFLFLRRSGTK